MSIKFPHDMPEYMFWNQPQVFHVDKTDQETLISKGCKKWNNFFLLDGIYCIPWSIVNPPLHLYGTSIA